MIKKAQGILMVFLLWFGLYWFLNTPALPNPISTLQFTVHNMRLLLPHVVVSLCRVGIALFFSGTVGTLIGMLMARNHHLDAILSPLVYILYPIPKIAFLPVLMLLFGLGDKPKILLIISVVIFQFLMAAKDAVLAIDRAYFDSIKALNLKGWDVYKHLIIPAMLPNFFTALRGAIGVSIAVLFFAENFSTKFGIGYYIMNSYAMVNYQAMYGGIVVLSLCGFILFNICDILEKKLCPWSES